MGVKAAIGLKSLQFFLRGVIFLSAIVILAIYGFFLADLARKNLSIQTYVRAVEGIAGAAALYGLVGLLLLWCLAGHTLASAVAVFLDICFIAAFIYVAYANRGGASSCSGHALKTPFGTGDADTKSIDDGRGHVVSIPSFRTSCKLETASLAVAAIAIVFWLLAIPTELLIARNHRREKQYGIAAAAATRSTGGRRLGLFGRKRRAAPVDPNVLPAHAEPELVAEKGPAYGNPKV